MQSDVHEQVYDVERDLDEIVPEFRSEYESIVKAKLDPKATFQTIRDDIGRTLEQSRLQNSKRSKVILNNVGECLMKFGDVAVGGASLAFPATMQCWNVVSVIIGAIQKHQEVLDGFVTLMERSCAFLKRLNTHLQKRPKCSGVVLPMELREPAYRILRLFLGALKASYELTTEGKWKKLKTYMKIVLFNDDRDVAARMEEMETTIRDFVDTQINEILIDVKGLARHCTSLDEIKQNEEQILVHIQDIHGVTGQMANVLQQMRDSSEGLASRQQHTDNLSKIRRSFGLGGDEPWIKRHKDVSAISVEGTGEWLRTTPLYKQWSDTLSQKVNVLTLHAEPGCGKTHIINWVIEHLHKSYDNKRGLGPVHIAQYYFSEEKDESFERCLGSIFYQFARTEDSFAKAAANACEKQANTAGNKDTWMNMMTALVPIMKGTYFVCIDGYDARVRTQLTDATVCAMARHATSDLARKNISIRFIFSGTEEILPITSIDLDSIAHITLNNESDLRIVIENRINQIKTEKPGFKTILADANVTRLVNDIKDYNHLNMKFAQISMCSSEEEVQDVINKTGLDWDNLLREKIQALHSSLNPSQVEHLNEILTWFVGLKKSKDRSWVALKVLQGMLYLKFHQTFFLDDLIARFYPRLLTFDEDGDVVLRSADYYRILCPEIVDPLGPGSPSPEEITKPEIEMCKRIIMNACGEHDYDRFGFADFFRAMFEKRKTNFFINADAAQITILSSCVEALHAKPDEVLEGLQNHAAYWFYEHLKSLMDTPGIRLAEKFHIFDIGAKLVDLFFDPELIDSWFTADRVQWLKLDWVVHDEFIDPLLKFWKASYATGGFPHSEEKDIWILSLLTGSVNKFKVLDNVARRMASRWFTCGAKATMDYLWIAWGIFMQSEGGEYDETTQPPLAHVDAFLKWVCNSHTSDDMNAIWIFCKGRAYVALQYDELAVEAFKQAEKELSENWWLLYEASCAHRRLKNYTTSLEYIKKLKLLGEELVEQDKEYKSIYWTDILLPEVRDRMRTEDYETAASCSKKLLQEEISDELMPDSGKSTALKRLFKCWIKLGKFQEIIDHVLNWRDSSRSPAYWLGLVSYDLRIHDHIIVAAKKTSSVDTICSIYQQAQETMSYPALGALLQTEGALRFYAGQSNAEQDLGIKIWENIIEERTKHEFLDWTIMTTSCALIVALLDMATLPGLESTSSDASNRYTKSLQKLCEAELDTAYGSEDPRVCLTRLYILQGDSASAYKVARKRLYGILDHWSEEFSEADYKNKFRNLAQMLTVLEDDENAITAWQAMKPRTDAEGPAIDGNASMRDKIQLKAYATGFRCDGCGVEWDDYLENCWVCRHCHDVQFCDTCYEKNKQMEFHPRICNRAHKMLRLPPVPVEEWSSASKEQIVVAGQKVLLTEWLDHIRDKYELELEKIELWKLQQSKRFVAAARLALAMGSRRRRRLDKTLKTPEELDTQTSCSLSVSV